MNDRFSALPDDLSADSWDTPTEPDGSACDDLRRIREVLPLLGRYELRGMRIMLDRLFEGQSRYGRLDVLNDARRRDWHHEAGEELADAIWYQIFHAMARWCRGSP